MRGTRRGTLSTALVYCLIKHETKTYPIFTDVFVPYTVCSMARHRPEELRRTWAWETEPRPPTPHPFSTGHRGRVTRPPIRSHYRHVFVNPQVQSGRRRSIRLPTLNTEAKQEAINAHNRAIKLRPAVPQASTKRVRFRLPDPVSPVERSLRRLSLSDPARCSSCGQKLP